MIHELSNAWNYFLGPGGHDEERKSRNKMGGGGIKISKKFVTNLKPSELLESSTTLKKKKNLFVVANKRENTSAKL